MQREKGFTLAEVLAALVIMGLVCTLVLDTMNWQLKLTKRGGERIDNNYASRTALECIEREIRTAKTITLQAEGVLKVGRVNGQTLMYYVDDKDSDGIKDLYQQIDGVPTPLVSNLVEARFAELSPGVWQITLVAQQGGEENRCQIIVKKRAG